MYLKHNRNIKIISKLQVYHDTLRPTYQLLLPDGLVGPAMMNGSVLGTVYCHLELALTHFAQSYYWIVHLKFGSAGSSGCSAMFADKCPELDLHSQQVVHVLQQLVRQDFFY